MSIYLSRLYSPCGPWPLFQFVNLGTVGLFGRGISPSQGHCLHPEQQKQNKPTHTSMPRAGFEPRTPVLERAKTVHDLARPLGISLTQNSNPEKSLGNECHVMQCMTFGSYVFVTYIKMILRFITQWMCRVDGE
jgi:hypothetical protein